MKLYLSFGVIAQREDDECGDEFGVVDHVKNFGKVNQHGQRTEWVQEVVETPV